MVATALVTARRSGLRTLSILSIGVGGMVGGAIFAVTGLTSEMTFGAAPMAFIVAGVVALLTAYSYLKLTLRYTGQGGTVEFLNRAYGTGIFAGSANILLGLNYVVLLAIHAFAFDSYGANLISRSDYRLWQHTLITRIIVLLAVFLAVGLGTHLETARLSGSEYVPLWGIVSGAMIIFLNYEGFELIANASPDVRNPEKSLPIAYFGGILVVIILYALIAAVSLSCRAPSRRPAGASPGVKCTWDIPKA